jgi:hypothetical protein
MLKILNCVSCEPIINTRIYPSEFSVGFLFNVPWYSLCWMYSRYSDVSLKNDTWRKIWIRDIESILMM